MKTKNKSRESIGASRRTSRDKAIKYVVERVKEVLGPVGMECARRFNVDIETTIRIYCLSHKCESRREELGWDVKTAAKQVGVPEYRIKAIESGTLWGFSQKEVFIYTEVLGLRRWFSQWRKSNQATFDRVRPYPDRQTSWAKALRGTSA